MNIPYFFPSSTTQSLALVLLNLMILASACGKAPKAPSGSRLAEISVKELSQADYDRYELQLQAADGTSQGFPKRSYPRSNALISARVMPGKYKISLDYFQNQKLIYSADFCPDGIRNNVQTLQPGPNLIELMICNQTKEPVTESAVKIVPKLANPGAASSQTFSVRSSQVVDATGKPFVMRGVNNPHNYYPQESFKALTTIKDLGFNSVRIVWCADTLVRVGRCEAKDQHPVQDLQKILQRMRELKLVAVLNLQNATGSDSADDLQKMVDYLVRADVKKVLIDNQDIVLINIANEWYGSWDKTRNYVDAYLKMIPQLRFAGLNHVLLIDARGYGQDFSSIPEHATELLKLDSNLLFSSHMYDIYNSPTRVKADFLRIRDLKIPFVVGEFACSHGSRGAVDCATIMEEAENGQQKVGTLAWSFAGNSSDLADLDMVSMQDWKTLTRFGEKLINFAFGVKASSREAGVFASK